MTNEDKKDLLDDARTAAYQAIKFSPLHAKLENEEADKLAEEIGKELVVLMLKRVDAECDRLEGEEESGCGLIRGDSSMTKQEVKPDADYLSDLRAAGFGIVEDGGAVIVIGKRDEIPVDRPVGVTDLLSPTRARRFDSAKAAVAVLIRSVEKRAGQ